jgi:hypothetical protein
MNDDANKATSGDCYHVNTDATQEVGTTARESRRVRQKAPSVHYCHQSTLRGFESVEKGRSTA